jgi:hypothetical protein
MNRRHCAAVAVALVAMTAPATANASLAGVSQFGSITYSASPGETNRVSLSRDGDAVVIEDAGAEITPGQRCERVTPNRVRCPNPQGVTIELGDGNDTAAMSDDLGDVVQSPPNVYGEQGDDVLTGSASRASLSGGAGRDELRGGRGTTFMNASASTTQYPFPPEAGADTVTCANSAVVRADAIDNVTGGCIVTRVESPAPAPDRLGTKGKCKASSSKRGVRRIARTKYAVVFTKGDGIDTYACMYSRGRIWKLPDDGGGSGGFATNGRFVTYSTLDTFAEGNSRTVVFDLRKGVSTWGRQNVDGKLVLKMNGSVAWIAPAPVFGTAPPAFDVRTYSVVTGQEETLVARSATIDRESLKLSADRTQITWTDGGQTHSAPLP